MKKIVFLVFLLSIITCTSMIYAQSSSQTIEYTIRSDDTYYNISNRFKTTVDLLISLNPNVSYDNLIVGNKIKVIPSKDVSVHKMKQGETLWRISNKYNIPLSIIAKHNNIKDTSLIRYGDFLAVPQTVMTNIYFIKSEPKQLVLISEKRRVAIHENLYVNTMLELIKGSKDKNISPLLDKKTEINSVKIVDKIAHVDFCERILNINVGATGEMLTLNAIANTLTEYPEIEGVLLYVNGKKLDTLAGHFEIEKPLKGASSS